MNQIACEFNRFIFWAGFFKGIAFICAILAAIHVYKYFKNKNIKVNIEVSERKAPRL